MNQELLKEIESISDYYRFTIDFSKSESEIIEEFQNNVDWDHVVNWFRVSEAFIEKFQDKVNWNDISYNQKLSESFIRKFYHKINLKVILDRQFYLSEDFINKIKLFL